MCLRFVHNSIQHYHIKIFDNDDDDDDDDDDELFCGMIDQIKAFSLISRWDHCQGSSPSRISYMS